MKLNIVALQIMPYVCISLPVVFILPFVVGMIYLFYFRTNAVKQTNNPLFSSNNSNIYIHRHIHTYIYIYI